MEELFEVRTNQLKILQIRGYLIPDEELKAVSSLESFILSYGTNPGSARMFSINIMCIHR